MREKTRDAIQKALFEAFFVVLAVALALAANEWRQGRADRARGEAAMVGIVEELKSNRAAVQEALDYHSGRLQMIRRLEGEARAPSPRDFPRGFISPARVFQTAWDTASATGALSHLEYSRVLELSQLYARQHHYQAQEQAFGEIIYRELFRAGVGGLLENPANLASIINAFSYRERQLVDFYDQTLAGLGAPPPAAQ